MTGISLGGEKCGLLIAMDYPWMLGDVSLNHMYRMKFKLVDVG